MIQEEVWLMLCSNQEKVEVLRKELGRFDPDEGVEECCKQ
jgi:hypothetical protein